MITLDLIDLLGGSQNHWNPRRGFLKATAAGGAAAGMGLFASGAAASDRAASPEPPGNGRPGRRYLIRGGAVMSMDKAVRDFAVGDVLVEGKRILAVGANLSAWGVPVIDARGKIVMPGFIDTHHHLFETALRSYLADGLLFDGLDTDITQNYFQKILLSFAPVCRPQDVYINTLFGSLAPSTTVLVPQLLALLLAAVRAGRWTPPASLRFAAVGGALLNLRRR